MFLRHMHLRITGSGPGSYPPYTLAMRVQEHFRRELLAYKDICSRQAAPPTPPPTPTLISFTPPPTYTLGRRQKEPLSRLELARLQARLRVTRAPTDNGFAAWRPTVHETPRGGLATYHGPGQAVLWPVLDLAGGTGQKRFTVRCYTRLLEDVTIEVLRTRCGIEHARTDEHPGVWVPVGGDEDTSRKVAAVGVHLRRHVSGLGTAINVDGMGLPPPNRESSDELQIWEDDTMPGNSTQGRPWARIVPCGLEGREVTSVRHELGEVRWAALVQAMSRDSGPYGQPERAVAWWWAEELARRLGLQGVRHLEASDAMVEKWMHSQDDHYCMTQQEKEYIQYL